jgi:hypothetical protein
VIDEKATDPAAGDAVVTPADDTALSQETTQKTPTDSEDPEARAASEPAEGQDGEPTDEKGEGKEKARNRVPLGERFRQITSRRRLAERERDNALRENQLLRRQLGEYQRRNPEEMSYDEREQARIDTALIRRDLRQTETKVRSAEQDAEEARVEAHNARVDDFVTRCQAAEKAGRVPGVLKAFQKIDVTVPMAEFIARSPLAPEMAFYLSRPEHAEELAEIQRLTDPRERPTADDLREADIIMAGIHARLKPGAPRKATTTPNTGTTLNGGSPPPGAPLEELAKQENPLAYIDRRRAEWAKGKY